MVIGRLLVMEIRPLQTDVHLGNLVLLNLISRGMLFCGGNGKEIERRKRVNFVFSIESQNYNVKNIGNDLSAKNADKKMPIKTTRQLEKIHQYLSEQSECSCRDICMLLISAVYLICLLYQVAVTV